MTPVPEHLLAQQTFDETLIPQELKDAPCWTMWAYEFKDGDFRKVPKFVSAHGHLHNARSNDPGTWMPFDFARDQAIMRGMGLNFVLHKGEQKFNPIVGIDIDLPADEPAVREIIDAIGTYTEISPSGSGVRMFLRGRIPGDCRKNGPFEVYEDQKTLSVTGNAMPGCPLDISDVNEAFDDFYATYIYKVRVPLNEEATKTFMPAEQIGSVEDILRAAERHGKLGRRLLDLYHTGVARDGYFSDDKTRVDLHFMSIAAEIAGNNPALLHDFYVTSALYVKHQRSAKWFRLAYRDVNHTYGEATIHRAIIQAAEKHRERQLTEARVKRINSPVHEYS